MELYLDKNFLNILKRISKNIELDQKKKTIIKLNLENFIEQFPNIKKEIYDKIIVDNSHFFICLEDANKCIPFRSLSKTKYCYIDKEIIRIGAVGDGSCLLHSIFKGQYGICIPKNEVQKERRKIGNFLTYEDLGPGLRHEELKEWELKDLKKSLLKNRWLSINHIYGIARFYEIGIIVTTHNIDKEDIEILQDIPIDKEKLKDKERKLFINTIFIPDYAKFIIVLYWQQSIDQKGNIIGLHFESLGLLKKYKDNLCEIQTAFHKNDKFIKYLLNLKTQQKIDNKNKENVLLDLF